MKDRGIETSLIRVLKEMYREERSAIIMNGEPGRWFEIKKGVRQGGSSSPICFNMLPNELAHEIQTEGLGVEVAEAGKIGILLYADDIVLLAMNNRDMRKVCEVVERWLARYKLKVNIEKSEVVLYDKGSSQWSQ